MLNALLPMATEMELRSAGHRIPGSGWPGGLWGIDPQSRGRADACTCALQLGLELRNTASNAGTRLRPLQLMWPQ